MPQLKNFESGSYDYHYSSDSKGSGTGEYRGGENTPEDDVKNTGERIVDPDPAGPRIELGKKAECSYQE